MIKAKTAEAVYIDSLNVLQKKINNDNIILIKK